MDKISVIVPVYNSIRHLGGCVESLLKQDDENYEIILVDDASTDGSAAVCDELAAADKRIRALHPIHSGAAGARNAGIVNASGKLICFVDSDDYVESCYLTYLRKLLEENDADISACGHDKPLRQEINTKAGAGCCTDCGSCSCSHLVNVYEGDEVLKALLYQKDIMSVPWGYLSKKSLWDKVTFPEGTEAEDMGTIYRLFMGAGRLAVGYKVCYHYVQDKQSTIYTTQASRNRAYYLHSREMVKRVNKARPACHKAALGRHFSACSQILSEMPFEENSALRNRVYRDIKLMGKAVSKDREGRLKNRAAAAVSGISVRALHLMLRGIYLSSTRRLM